MASTRNRFARSKRLSSVASAVSPVTAIPESAPALMVIDDQRAAANHQRFDSESFNAFGVIESPKLTCSYVSPNGNADAALLAHPVNGKWFAGFDFSFRTTTVRLNNE